MANKLKVAHVQVIPKLSGVQQVSLDILSGLPDEKFDKYLICGKLDSNSSIFVDRFEANNVKIIQVESLKREISRYDIKAFWELRKIFKQMRFDIVHTNSTKPGVVARIAAKISGINKVIHTVHGVSFHEHMTYSKRIFYYVIEFVSCIFGDINVLVNQNYRKYYPVFKNVVIYNGVDFSKLQVKKEKKSIINVAFMARLDEQKNPLLFIEAIKLLKLENKLDLSKVNFILAGDGELKSQCESLISKYNLNENIEMVGWIEDKSKFLSSIDIICQPSKWEAFGLVFVEAGFFKIPCIGSDVEGIPEVILDRNTGLIFKSNDVSGLKEAMFELIDNQTLRDRLGQNAFDIYTEKFRVEKMVSEYSALYKDGE
ncbi:hypothetical protein A3K86_13195 [Photobacterium jeanii]|uniref:Glycosyl transferase family 1 n=1 Tax=Photobacterium jeanii TaxID=858640 RepID=A0A178K891_9GAMM|nr:glycosyltransferase family 4 protein [Photobacterium jeanii]OAN13538.1 hypothetical protein A3K86_13195 [Photobacterium jeanii]PST88653.1 glycosyltransferase family 1 protein [Photobacterium jeanii]